MDVVTIKFLSDLPDITFIDGRKTKIQNDAQLLKRAIGRTINSRQVLYIKENIEGINNFVLHLTLSMFEFEYDALLWLVDHEEYVEDGIPAWVEDGPLLTKVSSIVQDACDNELIVLGNRTMRKIAVGITKAVEEFIGGSTG